MEFQLPPLPPPQPRRKLFGEQHRFCPNCGKALYDTRLTMDHVKSMMCGDACREDWEMKYARMILGKSAEEGK
jgi:hypothetical protein